MVQMADRDKMEKPDFLTEEQFAWFKDRTSSVDKIMEDAHADVQAYLANPDGRSTGATAQGGFPTLLITTIGRKSGEKRTNPLVFLQDGENMVVVGSLAGYEKNPAWYLNLQANPQCWVQVDRRKMTVAYRDATEEERKAYWPKLDKVFPAWGYFQKQTERPFPIVILSPSGPA